MKNEIILTSLDVARYACDSFSKMPSTPEIVGKSLVIASSILQVLIKEFNNASKSEK